MSTLVPGWVERARLLQQAGPHAAAPEEIAAVHAAFYPNREAVCLTCPGKLGVAYMAIMRYLGSLPADSSTTLFASTIPMSKPKYSFTDSQQTYRPHNSPEVFSNANLTDGRVAMLLKGDPALALHFGITEAEGPQFVAEHEAEVAALAAATAPAPVSESTTATVTLTTSNPLADENSDVYKAEFAKLDALRREELDAIYTDEVKEGDAKSFPNKAELIKAILAFRAK
ncbi:hypothetical protein [Hymenobacter sp. AT01-02]|uniref:hypothetical protein n=1 Tax=Hymenobacter sp. AT01-02 TaxID=1571877 RepID=UPI0005F0F535|nr:hypothetical protein [Hymenobacter sp. AT01-02]